jgi:hypothetical protein
MGRSKFRPFVGGKSYSVAGRARPVRFGGRQGLVGTRKWGQYICEFWAAFDADFTVTIPLRLQRAFAAADVESKKLEGRRIRVCGWIEQRGGPIIAAEAPEQIELIN